jgi:hypothetical protein
MLGGGIFYCYTICQASSALYAGMKDLACLKMECCSASWRPANYSRLEQLLGDNLVGQHIAQDMIVRAVRGHQRNRAPSKPLVLSFHGWTGSGKNFVSQFISDSFYKLGLSSQFVHLFIATLHFTDVRQAGKYKVRHLMMSMMVKLMLFMSRTS